MENFNDSISEYNRIFNKYNLGNIKIFKNNNSNKELDDLINDLNKERVVGHVNNSIILKNPVVYLSERLLHFFYNNNYIIDSPILYSKLQSRIISLIDYYNIQRIKKTDDEIYNDLQSIRKNYLKKNNLIKQFIEKYTSNSELIKIKI